MHNLTSFVWPPFHLYAQVASVIRDGGKKGFVCLSLESQCHRTLVGRRAWEADKHAVLQWNDATDRKMQFCHRIQSSPDYFQKKSILFKFSFHQSGGVVLSTGSWCGWWWWIDDDDVDDNNHNDVVHQEGHATAEQQIVGGGDGVGVGAPASVVHLQDHATECLIVDAAPACCYRHSDGFLSWSPHYGAGVQKRKSRWNELAATFPIQWADMEQQG